MTDTIDNIISTALERSISYPEYTQLVNQLVDNEGTTGPKQVDDLIYYTKLNAQRSHRLNKTIGLDDKTRSTVKLLNERYTWLVITESWCGDAAQILPLLNKMAEENPRIVLRTVLRDENLELMDEFLTNGGRSIPKLLILNESNQVVGTWGPRPAAAQALYDSWKNDPEKAPYKEFQVEMQKWYLKDKGRSTFQEVSAILTDLDQPVPA